MSSPGRIPLWVMASLNLLLIVWVWLGRIVFGVGGWFMLLLAPVALVMLAALLVTTILAFSQRDGGLTTAQRAAQITTWVGMFGSGAFLPDFGDTEESYTSLLGKMFGNGEKVMALSWTITLAFAALTVVAYLVLLVLLIARRRRSREVSPAV